jgi:hypothetical protein
MFKEIAIPIAAYETIITLINIYIICQELQTVNCA